MGESEGTNPADEQTASGFTFRVERYGSTASFLYPKPDADDDWQQLLRAFSEEISEESTRPFAKILEVVQQHGCRTVVVEHRYIDSDFRSDYSKFWSQRFTDVGSSTARMHFFGEHFSASDAYDLSAFKSSYLGYVVLRPTPLGGVGRCVLAPPRALNRAQLTSVVDRPTLFGTRLTIEGVPFYQQDGEFLRCAHVAAWICQYVAFSRGAVARRLTADLDQALRPSPYRMLPSSGLSLEQLQGVLSGLGMPALFYDIGDLPDLPARFARGPRERKRERILRVVCKYLNSGFPVIVITSNGHAFSLVGWERTAGKTRVIACDDQVGPYEIIESPLRDSDGPDRGKWTALMIPLPEKTYLNGESAESRARDIVRAQDDLEKGNNAEDPQSSDLARLAPKIRWLRGRVSVRTKLMEATKYKELLLGQDRAPALVRSLRMAELPKWVWVVEFQDRDARDQRGEQCVEAEMVLDPTSSNDRPAFALVSTRSITVDAGRVYRGYSDDEELIETRADGRRWWSMISQLDRVREPRATTRTREADGLPAHE